VIASRSLDRVLVVGTCFVLVGAVLMGWTQMGVALGLGVAVGFTFGWVLTRLGWSYGSTVALAAAVAFVLAAAVMGPNWDVWNQQTMANYELLAAQDLPESFVAPGKVIFEENWSNVGAGYCFILLVLGVYVAVATASRLVRRCHALAEPHSGFLTTRPPEWLAWVAIGVAVLWFVDQKWPGTALRPVSWSAAMGLASVYWFNGLAIGGYALKAFKAHALVGVVLFVIFAQSPVLIIAGLFDTWGGFRVKIDRIVEARRKLREDAGDDEF
jgi:hypothetical protein